MRSALRRCCWIVALAVAIASPSLVQGQQLVDKDSLGKAYDQNRTRRDELFNGTATASGAGDKKIADACAKWFIYRITVGSVQLSQLQIVKVHNEFTNHVSFLMDNKLQTRNRDFVDLYGPALVAAMKEVLTANPTGKPEIAINAAMMIPNMARLKQNAIGDYLISLASDPKTEDAIRLFALKGLGEFLPCQTLDGNTESGQRVTARKARDVKTIDALVKYIETPFKTDGLDPEEAAAINYLRREAIISLARAEAPAVAAIKKVGKVEGAVAPTLMRVIAGDMEPKPNLQEKVEAAIGLCKMKYWNPTGELKIKHAHLDDYQPDLAVYLVGKTLNDFIFAYKSDWDRFAEKSPTRQLPRVPFKIDARRFEAALQELADNARGATNKAEQLRVAALPVLKKIAIYALVDNDQQLRQKVIPSLRPKSGSPFKTLKVTEIPLD